VTAPKRGLGRGLAALLGDTRVAVSPSQDAPLEIAVDRITPNPFQPRKRFDGETLDELKQSIAEYGVLVPILVRRRGDGYELIAGERRWRACALLQKATIPAIVRTSDDRETLEIAMVENLQREDLNPLEAAAGFAHLIEEFGFTQEQLSVRLAKSRPAIANTLRLLGLPDAIKAMLVDGRLSAGHGKALLAASDHDRMRLAQRAVDEGMTVRALEQLTGTEAKTEPHHALRKQHALSPEEHDFESKLRERFGARVSLVRAGRGGRIEFRFNNDDELVRLGDLLLGEPID
jgi:ParB family transcriptional regulator, chromosome partitioning protein